MRQGPIFTPVLLADEINRAPAKVQSALLEAMEERQVTIGDETLRAARIPFFVMATQNPIEHEGTYPLPEAQIDRFLLKLVVGYPSADEEHVIAVRDDADTARVEAVADAAQVASLQRTRRRRPRRRGSQRLRGAYRARHPPRNLSRLRLLPSEPPDPCWCGRFLRPARKP